MMPTSDSSRSGPAIEYSPPGSSETPEQVPFVIGIIGDFSGDKSVKVPVDERRFLSVDPAGIDRAIGQLSPRLNVMLPSGLDPRRTDVVVRHSFQSLDDFRPVSIIKSNEVLQTLASENQPAALQNQVQGFVRHPDFLRLESSWRGVAHVLSRIPLQANVEVRLLDLSLSELVAHESSASSWDETVLFRELFDRGLSKMGETPMACLVADYSMRNHPDSMRVLEMLATIGSLCHCPVFCGASPHLLGVNDFVEMVDNPVLSRPFEGAAYIKWRGIRESDDSRYLALSVPRMLARPPWDPIEIRGQQSPLEIDEQATERALSPDAYCWMNGAYGLAGWMVDLFTRDHYCAAVEEFSEAGIPGLCSHRLLSNVPGTEVQGPVELEMADKLIATLAQLGFLCLRQLPEPMSVTIPRAATVHRPPTFHDAKVSQRANTAASLPFVMVSSAFARVLMRMARDRLYIERRSVEDATLQLNRWLADFVGDDSPAPLVSASCEIKLVERTHDDFELLMDLQPRLPNNAMDQPIRLGAEVPRPG